MLLRLACLVFVALLLGVEPPKSITDPKKQEEISRLMIAVQNAELRLRELQQSREMKAAELEFTRANAEYARVLEDLRKEYHAEGCNLRVDKTWDCSAKKEPPVAKPEVKK